MNERIFSNEIDIDKEPYIWKTGIEGFLIVKRPRYYDERGSFQELVRIPDLEHALGRKISPMQSQVSFSNPNVLRGIHAESQVKIITPLQGKMLSVIVDLRPSSRTFGQFIMLDIDANESTPNITLCLDEGLGNSLYVYPDSKNLIYHYSVSKLYDPSNKGRGVAFSDKTLNIPWPDHDSIISDRDRELPDLESFINKFYG